HPILPCSILQRHRPAASLNYSRTARTGCSEVPEGLAGVAGGEPKVDAVGELADAAADLDQAQPQGIQVRPGEAGGGVQQQAEPVGPEPVAGEAVGEAGCLEVLDPPLGLAAVDVPPVVRLRRLGAGGDDEAGVGAVLQRLGVEDDPALPRPGVGL